MFTPTFPHTKSFRNQTTLETDQRLVDMFPNQKLAFTEFIGCFWPPSKTLLDLFNC